MTELAVSHPSAAGFDPGAAGITPPSDLDRRGVFLVNVIVELGMADRGAVEMVERAAREAGRSIEKGLLDSGVLDEHQLARAIAERSGLDHVDLEEFEVDMRAAELIGRSMARRYNTVPIAFSSDGALIVATGDAFDLLGISDIAVLARSEVRRAIAAPSQIEAVIERLPEEPAAMPAPVGAEQEPESQEAEESQPEPEPQQQPEEPAPEPKSEPEQQEPEPEPGPEPEAQAPSEPPPAPAAPPAPAEPIEPAAAEMEARRDPPDGDLGDLGAELQALVAAAHNAETLAVTLGGRIEQLEGVEERAQRLEREQSGAAEQIAELERELAGARERIAELEQRLDGVNGATEKLKAANEVLLGLQKVLEESTL